MISFFIWYPFLCYGISTCCCHCHTGDLEFNHILHLVCSLTVEIRCTVTWRKGLHCAAGDTTTGTAGAYLNYVYVGTHNLGSCKVCFLTLTSLHLTHLHVLLLSLMILFSPRLYLLSHITHKTTADFRVKKLYWMIFFVSHNQLNSFYLLRHLQTQNSWHTVRLVHHLSPSLKGISPCFRAE